MGFIANLMIGDGQSSKRCDIIWNMIGSSIYAITSMLLGILVTRIIGADNGGIFFFAFSTIGQQMFIISYFGIRPMQSTDTIYNYSFNEYLFLRKITMSIAIIAGAIFAFLYAGISIKMQVIILMVIYKSLDGLADCYESEYQRRGKLYMTGKSQAFRTIISVIIFLILLLFSEDLILSSIGAVIGQLIGIFICDIIPIRYVQCHNLSFDKKNIKKIFDDSKWLFLSAFLDLYIFSSAKYAVDAHMSAADSGYFSTIFIPTSIINLMAGFIIRPVLTDLSKAYDNHEKKIFNNILSKIAIIIAIFTMIGCILAYIIGLPVLSFILGIEKNILMPYRLPFVIVILGGGFYAIQNLIYYALVILKGQRMIFAIYIIGCICAYLCTNKAVSISGIAGASYAYLAVMIVITILFILSLIYKNKKYEKL